MEVETHYLYYEIEHFNTPALINPQVVSGRYDNLTVEIIFFYCIRSS